MQSLPVPVLDHFVLNARDQLDAAQVCYESLGFNLTPRGYHTLGSINHLAVFGNHYLELVGVEPGKPVRRPEIMAFPIGLNGIVFNTEEPEYVHNILRDNGISATSPQAFSRPVSVGDVIEDAAFNVVRLAPEHVTYARVYFCQHKTPHLIWRDRWRYHPNGAIGLAGAVIQASEPGEVAAFYKQIFGDSSVRPVSGGTRLLLGLSNIDILCPERVHEQFGYSFAPQSGQRDAKVVALIIRCCSIGHVHQYLNSQGAQFDQLSIVDQRLVVPATLAFGVSLIFVE